MAMTYIDVEEYRDLVQCKTCLDIIINSFEPGESWKIAGTVQAVKDIMEGRQDAE